MPKRRTKPGVGQSKYIEGLLESQDNEALLFLELQEELKNIKGANPDLVKDFLGDNPAAARKSYRALARLLHPDKATLAGKNAKYSEYMQLLTTFNSYPENNPEKTEAYGKKMQDGIREMVVKDSSIAQEILKKAKDVRDQKSHDKEPMPKFVGMLFKSIQEEYKSASANFAQSIKSNKAARAKQTDYIDQIKDQLKADRKANDSLPNPDPNFEHHEAKVLYAVLALLEKDLKNEFRWTRWLGTQSRLENVVKKDMKIMREEFPGVNQDATKALNEFARKHPNLEMKKHFADIKEDRKLDRSGPSGP